MVGSSGHPVPTGNIELNTIVLSFSTGHTRRCWSTRRPEAGTVKGPVSPDGPARPARRPDNNEFTQTTYTHLALLCAALLAPGTGEQTLISALIDQVRSDAASIGVQIGDALPERRALVTAIGHLVGWGVLSERDGTATGWGERLDELLAPDPQVADQPRRSLRRKLVENPLVRREDLTDTERDVLSRERSELTRPLGEHFGLTVEVRSEGALAYDSAGSLTDVAFPGGGTFKQASLLLLAELIDLRRPTGGTIAILDNGRTVTGSATTWDEVDAALARLSAKHRRAWGATLVDQPERLRHEVVMLLTALGRATITVAGL